MTTVEFERDGPLAHVYLNRPAQRNALNAQMVEELHEVLDMLDITPEVQVLIVSARGPHFCAGADLRERAEESLEVTHARHRRLESLCTRLWNQNAVVLCAVRGWALGGGCELALSSDVVLADTTARFGLPEVRIGLIPGCGGTQLALRKLPRQIGAYLLLTGESISARAACRFGMVARAVAPSRLDVVVSEICQRLLANSPRSLAALKTVIRRAVDEPFEVGQVQDWELWHEVVRHEDYREGLQAFLEHRAPVFRTRGAG